jgi:hypothetical protein
VQVRVRTEVVHHADLLAAAHGLPLLDPRNHVEVVGGVWSALPIAVAERDPVAPTRIVTNVGYAPVFRGVNRSASTDSWGSAPHTGGLR